MEKFKNKVFLVKIPNDIFDGLNKSSPNTKIGDLKIVKGKCKPEFNLQFENGNNCSLIFDDNFDNFYFNELEKAEDMKINNIDYYGKLIIKDENKFIENIINNNKSNDKKVDDAENIKRKSAHSNVIEIKDNLFQKK